MTSVLVHFDSETPMSEEEFAQMLNDVIDLWERWDMEFSILQFEP